MNFLLTLIIKIMDKLEIISRIKHESGSKLIGIGCIIRNIDKCLTDKGLSSILINDNYDITIKDSIKTALKSLDDLHSIFKKYEILSNQD